MIKVSRTVPLVSMLAASAFSQVPQVDSTRFSVQASFRFGGLFGEVVDKEKSFYSDVGLQTVDSKGSGSNIDPTVTPMGLDLGFLYSFSRKIQAGAAFTFTTGSIQPAGASKLDADFVQEKSFLGRARFVPLEYKSYRFGLEAGAGWSFGTLHRFALAAKNLETIRSGILNSSTVSDPTTVAANVVNYIQVANRPIDFSGPRWEGSLLMVQDFNPSVGLEVRLGFHHTTMKLSSDPLAIYTPTYPTSIGATGLDVSIGVVGRF